jgi:serine/threonine-protein kinase RsbW
MKGVAQPTRTWELWLMPLPEAVGEARRRVRHTLNEWSVPEDAVSTAVLITSELVTNAIRCCDTQHLVRLNVTDDGEEVLLEVSDPSRERPRPVTAQPDDENGRGLLIVRGSASAFGVRDRDPIGKTVWATVKAGGRAW